MKTTKSITAKRIRRDRKEEILEKATSLFGEFGFQGTTLALVAEAVGLTEPGVLHYFPSKVRLLQGVLEYRDQKEMEKYSKEIDTKMNKISELFDVLERVVVDDQKNPGLIQLFIVLVSESIRSDHPSHDFFVQRYRRGKELYIKQFIGMQKFRKDVDPNELASLIIAMIDGMQIQWLLDPKKVNLTATFKLFSKMIVDYME